MLSPPSTVQPRNRVAQGRRGDGEARGDGALQPGREVQQCNGSAQVGAAAGFWAARPGEGGGQLSRRSGGI